MIKGILEERNGFWIIWRSHLREKHCFEINGIMKVVVKCIYYKAVTPSCDIIDMDGETWREFLYAKEKRRMEIVQELLGKECMEGYVREIAWIPLDGQNAVEQQESVKLTNIR